MLARYYFEVDFLCIIILVSLIEQTQRSNFRQKDQFRFIEVLICALAYVISDLAWIFNNNFLSIKLIPNVLYPLFIFLNVANGLLPGFMALAWLRFSECIQNRSFSKKQMAYLSIPLVLLFICVVSNPYTHVLFLMENRRYVRTFGPFIQFIVSYYYIALSVVLSLKHAKQANTLQERKRSLTISSFVIFPTIAALLQFLVFDMPILFVGVIISLINVYISLQDQLVLTDALTGLHNRTLLDQKIEHAYENLDDDCELWVLMIDANSFKAINDTYGHLEGDRALIYIANVLKEVCQKKEDYVCRYGGDEFVILHQTKKGEGCQTLMDEINEKMKQHTSYPLSVSIGFARYQNRHKNWQDVLKEADQKLYQEKKKIK